MEKTLGRKPKELENLLPCPEGMEYLWQWFREVCGPEPMTFTELQAWSSITGKGLAGWEADLLKSLDRIFRRVINE